MATPPRLICTAAALATMVLATSLTDALAAARLCGDRANLITMLKDKYKEVPSAVGLSQASTEAFEVFTSAKGTWTVIMTTSSGKTCVMAAGHSWNEFPRKSLDPET